MTLLVLQDLHAYYGKSHVLHGVNLRVGEGEIVCLLGRNGSGRSTTLKAIMGLVAATGSVRFRGQEMLGRPVFEIAQAGVGYVPESRDIFPTLTVRQNLLLGEKRKRRGWRAAPRWSSADMFGLFPQLQQREHTAAGVLSGGEQQMLALCRSLMGDPDLLLLDEPTEGLASSAAAQVAELLATLKARGVAVLMVEQKRSMGLENSDRWYELWRGEVDLEGAPVALQSASEEPVPSPYDDSTD